MNEAAQMSKSSLGIGMLDRPSPTLLQNIDNRIESLESQIARLKNVKQVMQSEGGILNVPIDDLLFAMNY